MDNIESLRKAIKKLHGCDSEYTESVPVKETFKGQTVWEGVVEVFNLIGHPKAKRCYAWSHAEGINDSETRYVVVLELPPVNSARTAVQANIVSRYK
ncbi:MAG TPA: hypothetical protein VLX68_10640 [Chitinivibrionales bacterium]|nr:hypothetical protein [Chitinivibrionales bacterium]